MIFKVKVKQNYPFVLVPLRQRVKCLVQRSFANTEKVLRVKTGHL